MRAKKERDILRRALMEIRRDMESLLSSDQNPPNKSMLMQASRIANRALRETE